MKLIGHVVVASALAGAIAGCAEPYYGRNYAYAPGYGYYYHPSSYYHSTGSYYRNHYNEPHPGPELGPHM